MKHLEVYIEALLLSNNINSPDLLTIGNISEKLDLKIIYDLNSFCCMDEIILEKSTKEKEWQDFGHELCHHLMHTGNHTIMHRLFINAQEKEADYFAYHFCVPTFMLDEIDSLTIRKIMNLFNVEYSFAVRRMEMYESKLMRRIEIAESKNVYLS